MKKNMLSALIALAVVTGCTKNTDKEQAYKKIDIGETVKDFFLKTNSAKDGEIYIQATTHVASFTPVSQQPFDGDVVGVFYTNKNQEKPTTVSSFVVDGVDIPYNNNPAYPGYGFQSLGNTSTISTWMKNLFGRKIKVAVGGSRTYMTEGNQIESDGFYVPQPIELSGSVVQSYTLNKNVSHTFTWTPDSQNPNGMVFLAVLYEAYESNLTDASMPDATEVIAFLEIPDNGSYSVTPSQVTGLPNNCRASIALARGNYQVITDPATGTQTLIYAITQSLTGASIRVVSQ